jgi:Bacterial inner membrane protein
VSANGVEWLGWCATGVFVGSYFCARPAWLRLAQMLGALLWLIYGALIGSTPVVVANVLVFSAAAWTAWRAQVATGTALPAAAASSSGPR